MANSATMIWHAATAEEVARRFDTDGRGLSAADAAERLRRIGPNALSPAREPGPLARFLRQFTSPLVVLLLVATGVSLFLWMRERASPAPYEAIAIFAVVLLNATMGFVQESRARAAVTALRAMSAATATVMRDGRRDRIPAEAIVPGDVLVVDEGDTVAADARVIESVSLKSMEAALTGESLPVSKSVAPVAGDAALGERVNMLFSGTTITYGHGRAVVVGTGMDTELGRIAGLIQRTPDQRTPMQAELDRTAKLLGVAVLAIAAVIIATILALDDAAGLGSAADALLVGVALAVAAVPEGLPAIVTAVLSIGTHRMAKRNAIVRNLAAVETLGSATVIAADKTGTLTQNRMTVRAVVTASGRAAPGDAAAGAVAAEARHALTIAGQANNAAPGRGEDPASLHGDPTEVALRLAARASGLDEAGLEARLPRIGEVPFSSERRMMSTLHRDAGSGRTVLFSKGAPDVLLSRCATERVGEGARPMTDERRRELIAANDALAGEAMRTLAVASRTLGSSPTTIDESLEQELEFGGLLGMIDPPRAEAKDAVARAIRGGIRPLMITGDHPRTASVIAAELGIGSGAGVVTGPELERMSDAELDAAVERVSVFARVSPEHKLRIVAALRRGGAIVAMTGDGVNDAPALKSADIGVAMGRGGTDAARDAADIVLADDNFATIVAAVEEGRAIYANIRKFLRYLLSSNIGEVLTMFFGLVLGGFLGLAADHGAFALPLLATQILWINLVTDGPPALALGLDRSGGEVMTMPPRGRDERVVTRRMWVGIAFVGLVMATATLLVIDASLPGGLIPGTGSLRHARTMGFTTLMLCQLFNVLNARSETRSAFSRLLTNRWLWGAIAISASLQVLVVHLPVMQAAFGTTALGLREWALCLGAASTVLWMSEVEKGIRRFAARPARPHPA
ncbi:MAG TPA: cation-translocating P-type ATPase [Gemmatimonadaceae bacterium]|nr:cation-translocating P-type ATPase [Gemmatimonadaceae bacterium]